MLNAVFNVVKINVKRTAIIVVLVVHTWAVRLIGIVAIKRLSFQFVKRQKLKVNTAYYFEK